MAVSGTFGFSVKGFKKKFLSSLFLPCRRDTHQYDYFGAFIVNDPICGRVDYDRGEYGKRSFCQFSR